MIKKLETYALTHPNPLASLKAAYVAARAFQPHSRLYAYSTLLEDARAYPMDGTERLAQRIEVALEALQELQPMPLTTQRAGRIKLGATAVCINMVTAYIMAEVVGGNATLGILFPQAARNTAASAVAHAYTPYDLLIEGNEVAALDTIDGLIGQFLEDEGAL